MKRRSFFATMFGGLLTAFLPKLKATPKAIKIPDNRIDILDMRHWGAAQGITQATNVRFDGCVVRPIDTSKPASFTIGPLCPFCGGHWFPGHDGC